MTTQTAPTVDPTLRAIDQAIQSSVYALRVKTDDFVAAGVPRGAILVVRRQTTVGKDDDLHVFTATDGKTCLGYLTRLDDGLVEARDQWGNALRVGTEADLDVQGHVIATIRPA